MNKLKQHLPFYIEWTNNKEMVKIQELLIKNGFKRYAGQPLRRYLSNVTKIMLCKDNIIAHGTDRCKTSVNKSLSVQQVEDLLEPPEIKPPFQIKCDRSKDLVALQNRFVSELGFTRASGTEITDNINYIEFNTSKIICHYHHYYKGSQEITFKEAEKYLENQIKNQKPELINIRTIGYMNGGAARDYIIQKYCTIEDLCLFMGIPNNLSFLVNGCNATKSTKLNHGDEVIYAENQIRGSHGNNDVHYIPNEVEFIEGEKEMSENKTTGRDVAGYLAGGLWKVAKYPFGYAARKTAEGFRTTTGLAVFGGLSYGLYRGYQFICNIDWAALQDAVNV